MIRISQLGEVGSCQHLGPDQKRSSYINRELAELNSSTSFSSWIEVEIKTVGSFMFLQYFERDTIAVILTVLTQKNNNKRVS